MSKGSVPGALVSALLQYLKDLRASLAISTCAPRRLLATTVKLSSLVDPKQPCMWGVPLAPTSCYKAAYVISPRAFSVSTTSSKVLVGLFMVKHQFFDLFLSFFAICAICSM